ncbi:MAG: TrkH family potassium uptake protein [Bacillota bacterium]
MIAKIKEKLTYYQMIAIAYVFIIAIGTFLLAMPISSNSGTFTSFIDSLFTATSATCVTGLVVFDTYTHWSIFGQIVILILIQIGGIGFMTIMTRIAIFLRGQLSLTQKTLFAQSTGNIGIGGTPKLIKQVVVGTLAFEGAGALLLCTSFIPAFGWGKGIYYSIFHSVSAFCNAGFDLMGVYGEFSSLTAFVDDPIVVITIVALIIIGGLGFLVWSDLLNCKCKWKSLTLHSKVVLGATACLVVIPFLLLMIFEYNSSMADLSFGGKILASLFQAVTPRTAGFNTVNMLEMSESGRLLMIVLMFIGGNSGSTAGGIKTTTFVVILLAVIACIKRKDSITVSKRRLENGVVLQATAIVVTYLAAIVCGCLLISFMQQDFSMSAVLFEVTSALGTVGLTLGITPLLNVGSQLVIIFLMYAGRVGFLSLVMIFARKKVNVPLSRPVGKIIIG